MSMTRRVTGAVLAVGMLFGGASAAMAGTTYPPEGGTWNYGVSAGVHLYSDYFNQHQCHGSSNRNDWGYTSSPNVAGNVWANSSQPTTSLQDNRAYYRVC